MTSCYANSRPVFGLQHRHRITPDNAHGPARWSSRRCPSTERLLTVTLDTHEIVKCMPTMRRVRAVEEDK